MLRGFDVSHYQGAVDWAAMKTRYGVLWGAAKATEAETGKDSRFAANWRGMKAAGLVRLAYSFAHPDNDPTDDAQAFLAYVDAAGGFGPEDIAVMDMESNPSNLPMLTVRDWLAKWADIVTKATGRKPFLYTGSGYIRNNSTLNLRPHYAAWWYPQYPSAYDGKIAWPKSISGYPATNNWGGPPDIWQFTQSFPAYGGKTDANIANMTLADLKTRGHPSTPGTPNKPPATTTEGNDMGTWTEAQLRAMMQAENEEYAIRFWIDPTGTGTALRNQVTYILNQQSVLSRKLDELLGRPAAAADAPAPVLELHQAMSDAVDALTARPAAAALQPVLNADGSMSPGDEPAPEGGSAP